MANEVFIARQDTLESVKGTVEGIDTKADTTITTLGDVSGGGTDLLTQVEALTAKVEALQSSIDGMSTAGGTKVKKITHGTLLNSSASSSSSKTIATTVSADKTIVLLFCIPAAYENSYTMAKYTVSDKSVAIHYGYCTLCYTIIELE